MVDVLILEVIKGLGISTTGGVELVQDVGFDLESSLGGGPLDGVTNRLNRIGYNPAKRVFDLTKEAVFDRMPLGRIRRVVRDPQAQAQALTEAQ